MRRLVILSVPFVRIARVVLSELVLGVLRQRCDVVIVAPFADVPAFQRSFGGPDTSFVRWSPRPFRRMARALYAASEIMRRYGYYRKLQRRGMAYYVVNERMVFDSGGADTEIRGARALGYRAFGTLGRWRGAWRVAERALGRSWASQPALEALAGRYDAVTLVQSANWGDQDRALARLSRSKRWRRVLVPYTTDQLDVNGYLINEFDAVCVQGSFEAECARGYHAVNDDRVVELGSVWLRHLRRIRDRVWPSQQAAHGAGDMVMYAGASPLYYSRAAELEAVRALAAWLARSHPLLTLVYRPVEDDPAVRRTIETDMNAHANVAVQWPAATEIGLDTYPDHDHVAALERYALGLKGCRVMVMSNVTSLALDVSAAARCAVISNQYDPTGLLRRRRNDLLQRPWFAAVTFVTNIDELLRAVDRQLADPSLGRRAADALLSHWDFPHDEVETRLLSAVAPELARGSARDTRERRSA